MKKFLLFFSLTLIFVACKQKNNPQPKRMQRFATAAAATESACKDFDTLYKLNTAQQVSFLQDHMDWDCKEAYDSCRVAVHGIPAAAFDAAVAAYWVNRPVVYTPYTLDAIKKLSEEKCYSQFIAANSNNDDNIALSAVNTFTTTPNCYSIPLFYSIGNVLKVDDQTELLFTKGKIGTSDKVIFKVRNTSNCYDATSFPL